MSVIEVAELRRTYHTYTGIVRRKPVEVEAVRGISFDVGEGELFGLLGPNGAGKTTTIKMMNGLVRPTSGRMSILGRPLGDLEARRRIGFLPEHFRFHEWLRAEEFLDFHASLYGLSRSERRRRIPDALRLVGLEERARSRLRTFSKGMLQRIGLAQALLNNPELVFLDEPTSALDPFGRMLVRGIIRDLKARGTTVFLNSHLLGEVEATCDRVSFIKGGRVLRTLGLREFREGALQVELRVDAVTPQLTAALDDLVPEWRVVQGTADVKLVPAIGEWRDAHGQAGAVATTEVAETVATPLELTVSDEELLPIIAERTLASGARLYALAPRRLSLEQLFLDIVGREDSGQ